MNLSIFKQLSFLEALRQFFIELNVPVNYIAEEPDTAQNILKSNFRNTEAFHLMGDVYFLGMVDDAAFKGTESIDTASIKTDYDGLLIFGVILKPRGKGLLPTRSQLSEISRAFNREFKYTPVVVVFKYDSHIAFANTERVKFKQEWREGEKVGKVTTLKDIDILNPHAAHSRILDGLSIDTNKIDSFQKLYNYWQTVFSIQALNDQFYGDLQDWFYYASRHIKLPIKPDYIPEKENTKNFLIRLLARTMFCWFVKEKGLINTELLELRDWDNRIYPLTNDISKKNFLQSNSYYRGILQNIFFNALNQKEKSSIKDFEWTQYWNSDFKIDWLVSIPYLNGGIFDRLEEDNADENINDSILHVPNFLFYGIEEEQEVIKGKGKNKKVEVERVKQKGLNSIFKSFKFTLEENTPYEEDIALDPELLGLVFENLLAELDPNLEENTKQSIRKLTGSYYTPRKIIQEMVNESLFIYLKKFINPERLTTLKKLVYDNKLENCDDLFCESIVNAIDHFKVLDPACGSGAFPMGMLHSLVDILKLVDFDNSQWLKLKLKSVDKNYREEFEKTLKTHLDNYGRKLGIIRDSIYGIDIQPMAVQITKLRFFISLLIDQKVGKGITPMPNIETKIICADSLKNLQPDMFANDAIDRIESARIKYYQPDLSLTERQDITNDIIDILNDAFPSFSIQITGKSVQGENKKFIRNWFTHATVAAPFFNIDFFYPELKGKGFDCVIGNPPYGGTKVGEDVCKFLAIESNDPYGAFIARFLPSGDKKSPLKNGGILAFIVSDTFMTIKSHLDLRRQIMDNYIHKMIRVHPDTFRATVNTAIIICERNIFNEELVGGQRKFIANFNANHICQMVDLTNISIHDNYSRFIELLHKTEGIDYSSNKKNISNPEYAIYYYPQKLIRTNSNLPFFVANPKLFSPMNDGNDSNCKPKTKFREIGSKRLLFRNYEINNREFYIANFGDIAVVAQGIKTGDNDFYLYQNPDARGNYKSINEYEDFLLTEKDLISIRKNDTLRLEIIEKGISKNDNQSSRYFNGKYLVPLDKGGESDASEGFMPNYFIPTDYYIDWSESSVERMKSLTIGERDGTKDKKICSRFQNVAYNFKEGITFSPTGIYSPTFRINSTSIFESKGSTIFLQIDSANLSIYSLLGIFCSKLYKFIFKNFISHTVETGEKSIKSVFIQFTNSHKIELNVRTIIEKQKVDPYYDYASQEQIQIDSLVYEAYGFNSDDVEEVENWYARRYPKLSSAQKQNLRSLGKSDDYLVLYGLKNKS